MQTPTKKLIHGMLWTTRKNSRCTNLGSLCRGEVGKIHGVRPDACASVFLVEHVLPAVRPLSGVVVIFAGECLADAKLFANFFKQAFIERATLPFFLHDAGVDKASETGVLALRIKTPAFGRLDSEGRV